MDDEIAEGWNSLSEAPGEGIGSWSTAVLRAHVAPFERRPDGDTGAW